MNEEQNQTRPGWLESVRVLGGILGVVAVLFGLVQTVTQQPGIALFIAVLGALVLSVYFVRQGHLLETVISWLVVIVIGLAIYVLVPRSGTVTGVLYDSADLPLSNEQVLLVDSQREERRARTDADGRYVFTDVPVGRFELAVGDVRTGGEIKSPLVPRQEFDLHLPAPIAGLLLTDTPLPMDTDAPTPAFTGTPTVTATPEPTATDTPLPPPCPLLEIFPQASACDTYFVFKNEGGSLVDTFKSTGACVHSGSFGLELAYSNAGPANAGWGAQWSDTPAGRFDASGFSQFRFWVRGEAGEETFQIGIRDTANREIKIESRTLTVVSTQWAPVTVDLTAYADGLSLASIANVNLGFNETHGTGTICIDDLEFIP